MPSPASLSDALEFATALASSHAAIGIGIGIASRHSHPLLRLPDHVIKMQPFGILH